MTNRMHATAKQVWRMTTDAPDAESFIVLCEELAVLHLGEGLDSWDLGDALGALIQIGTRESIDDPMTA